MAGPLSSVKTHKQLLVCKACDMEKYQRTRNRKYNLIMHHGKCMKNVHSQLSWVLFITT